MLSTRRELTLLEPAPTPTPDRRTAAVRATVMLGVAAALLGLRVLSDPAWTAWLPDAGRDFVTLAASVFIESLPFVFLGIAISVLVQVWVPDSVWQRYLPRNQFARRLVLSLLGVLFPVCECGNVPLARGLMMRGVDVGGALTFLLAAPILNPVTIITTYQAFGWRDGILVGRIAGAFVIANLLGWLFSRHPDPSSLLTPRFEAGCHTGPDRAAGRAVRSARLFAEETTTMLPALIAGSAIAGAIQVGVPRALLVELGGNPVLSVLVLMALAFVVSVCSNVDAFFILSFAATFSPGGIVAFLVFGAMVDVKMLALLRTTFTTRALALIATLVGLCALVIGMGMNLAL